MTQQKKKHKAFIASAASAALVASAVAPIAASAASFSDTKGNTHELPINALVDAGIIKGYPDGTFKPNKQLSRSDVVKMMGKWLVTLGYEVPSDYKTNPRYKDLTSKTNDELLKYAALVKDSNVFRGYEDGTLGAAKPITRENMAIVLVRALDTINKTDLVKQVAGLDFDKEVQDRAQAKSEARLYIDVLDYYDITKADRFMPKKTTTRGQFASFLYKTSKIEAPDKPENTDKEAPKLVYNGEKTITLQKSEKFTMPTVTAKDNVDKTVEVKSVITDEKGERVKEIDSSIPGTYKITYTAADAAGNNAEDLVITVVVEGPKEPAVEKVTAVNAQKIAVLFNHEVNKADAETAANYSFVGLPAGTNVTPVLQPDNQTVWLHLDKPIDNDSTFSITVKPVQTKADGKIKTEFFTDKIKFSDKDRPTFKDISYPQAGAAILNFSEELSSIGSVKVYENNSEVTVISGSAKLTDNKTGIQLTGLTANKEYRVVVTGAMDTSKNIISPNPIVTTINSTIVDNVKPEIVSLNSNGLNEVVIKFSKPLQQISNNQYVTLGGEVTQAANTNQVWNTETNTLTVAVNPINTNSVKSVSVSGYKDAAGNEGQPFTKNVTFSVIVPAITSTDVVKEGSDTYANFMFNTNMTAASNLTGVNLTGTLITPDKVVSTETINAADKLTVDSTNNKLVKMKLNGLEAGTYDLTLPKTAFNPPLDKDLNVKFTIERAANNNAPKVSADPEISAKTVTVTFDQEMGQSALDVNNYMVDDTKVFENAIFKSNKRTVELTLKDSSIISNGSRKLDISSNVKGLNGVALPAYSKAVNFTENVAPTISDAGFQGDTKIVLTFNEAVKSTQANAGLDVIVNNSKIEDTVASTADGSTQITLTRADAKPFVASGDFNSATVTVQATDSNTVTDNNGNKLKPNTVTVSK